MLILAGGDAHFKFADKPVTEDFLHAAKHEKPDRIELLGDMCDLYNTSRYVKEDKEFNAQDEVDETHDWLKRLRSAAPAKCKIDYHEGNHEKRLVKYLARGPRELLAFRALKMRQLLDLDKLNIAWHQQNDGVTLDGVLYMHGSKATKHPSTSVRGQIMEKYHRSMMVGHCHRFAHITVREYDTWHHGIEAGCMCTDEAGSDYDDVPSWTRAFIIVSDGFPHPQIYNH